MTREKALKIAGEFDGKRPASLDSFLGELGMTKEDFSEIVEQHKIKQ